MRFVQIDNLTRVTKVVSRAGVAETFMSRLVGLLGRSSLPEGEGLLIRPCSSIHMFGMHFAIDAVFFDANLRVVGLVESIKPNRISRVYPNAKGVLELPAGTVATTLTQPGDLLSVEPVQ